MGDAALDRRPVRIGRGRIVLLDALRGLCLIVMTIDHVPSNPIRSFSNPQYGLFGFFTAALGFVFLSGVVVGLVYDNDRVRNGMSSMCRRVLRRMRAIYFTQISMWIVIVVAVDLHLRDVDRWHLDLLHEGGWKPLFFSSTLLYEPEFFGLLPMYLVFLLLTPLILWQFGKGNVAKILAISAAIWLVSGLLIRLPANPDGVNFGGFNPIGYQFLFTVGLAFGTKHLSIDRLRPVVRTWLIRASVVLAVAFFVLRFDYAFGGPVKTLVDDAHLLYTSVQLGPLRLLNFAAFGVVLYWMCGKVSWNDVDFPGFRWLALLGRHSFAGLRVVDPCDVCVGCAIPAYDESHLGCGHYRSRDGKPHNPSKASRHVPAALATNPREIPLLKRRSTRMRHQRSKDEDGRRTVPLPQTTALLGSKLATSAVPDTVSFDSRRPLRKHPEGFYADRCGSEPAATDHCAGPPGGGSIGVSDIGTIWVPGPSPGHPTPSIVRVRSPKKLPSGFGIQ